MSDNLLHDFSEDLRRELGYDENQFAVRLLYEELDHNFYIYRLLWKEFGSNKALEIYRPVVNVLTAGMPVAVAGAMGIEEVKDIPTLGKMVEAGMTAFPVLYETAVNTEDLHVGRVHWCPNTFYSPAARHEMEMHSYFRSQVAITIDPLLTGFARFANEHGLAFELEVDCPQAMCTNANARFCEYVIRRKGSPLYSPTAVPVDEEAYVAFNMGDEEPLLYCLRRQGRTVAEQIPVNLLSFLQFDAGAYEVLGEILGKNASLDLYERLWASRAEKWTKEARLDLEIGKVRGLEDLSRIIVHNQKMRFTPYRVEDIDDRGVKLAGEIDPLVALGMSVLGKTIDDDYFQAVRAGSERLVTQVLHETGMEGRAKASMIRSMAGGDDRNEILIQAL
ncbi:MAG: hypothetical protein ACWGSD_13565 [Thermodesulfobacteriota bacterium]